jgi:hypothetical protein
VLTSDPRLLLLPLSGRCAPSSRSSRRRRSRDGCTADPTPRSSAAAGAAGPLIVMRVGEPSSRARDRAAARRSKNVVIRSCVTNRTNQHSPSIVPFHMTSAYTTEP